MSTWCALQVGSEGGAEEPALRHFWRGRMATSKQEQLDLFAGRNASDEDSSDADDMQYSNNQTLQASEVSQNTDSLQESSCSCQSDNIMSSYGSRADDEEEVAESSSSDADTTSSESESSSESSDDDPDGVSPVQV